MPKLRDKAGAGVPVIPGPPGKDAYELAITRGYFFGTLEQWLDHLRGKNGSDGESPYEIAVRNGFDGSEPEWLASLQGAPGKKADPGPRGPIGPMPRHEWRGTELRFQMAPDQWGKFVDLKGDKGDKGDGGIAAIGGGTVIIQGNSYMPAGW